MFFNITINIFYFCLYIFLAQTEEDFAIVNNSTYLWINTLFLLDMFVNLNLGYYDNGTLVTDRKKIFKNYSQNQAIYDFINFIAVLINVEVNITGRDWWIIILNSIALVKIFSLMKIKKKFYFLFCYRKDIKHIIKLIDLGINILYLSHFMGVMFYGVTILENN